jgi:hypothetical protein
MDAAKTSFSRTKFLTALLGIEVRTAAATALAILRCHAPPVGSYRKLR